MKLDKDKVSSILYKKQVEMVEYINTYLSYEERQRIGEDILKIMPNETDVCRIMIDQIEETNKTK